MPACIHLVGILGTAERPLRYVIIHPQLSASDEVHPLLVIWVQREGINKIAHLSILRVYAGPFHSIACRIQLLMPGLPVLLAYVHISSPIGNSAEAAVTIARHGPG